MSDIASSGQRPALVDTATAASMLGVAEGTMRNWRYRGKNPGPKWIRIGGQIRYPVIEIERYLAENVGAKCVYRRGGDA